MTMKEVDIETRIYIRDNEVVFNLKSHHKWGESDRNHLAEIVGQLKSYITTFISGDIYTNYPEAINKDRIIEIIGKYPFNEEANRIFCLLEKSSGFIFRFSQFDE